MRSALLAAAIFSSFLTAQIATAQETPQPGEADAASPRPHITYLDKTRTIYITDFESSVAPSPPLQPNAAPIAEGSNGNPRSNGTNSDPIEPGPHVARLISDTLLREFKKAGYKAKIIGARDPRPDEGMLIEGVFTQQGKDGQLRRATIEAGHPVDGVQLYVTTSNLLRPSKPLYEVVKPESAGGVVSAPIRLNPEVATLKFSVTGNFDDKAAKKAAEQIATELERLRLQAESEGLAGSDDPLNKYSKP